LVKTQSQKLTGNSAWSATERSRGTCTRYGDKCNASGWDENEQKSKYRKTWQNKMGEIVVGHFSSLFWSVVSDDQRSDFTFLSF
jgi:hypothetical protein